jgi:hypothetical protein
MDKKWSIICTDTLEARSRIGLDMPTGIIYVSPAKKVITLSIIVACTFGKFPVKSFKAGIVNVKEPVSGLAVLGAGNSWPVFLDALALTVLDGPLDLALPTVFVEDALLFPFLLAALGVLALDGFGT